MLLHTLLSISYLSSTTKHLFLVLFYANKRINIKLIKLLACIIKVCIDTQSQGTNSIQLWSLCNTICICRYICLAPTFVSCQRVLSFFKINMYIWRFRSRHHILFFGNFFLYLYLFIQYSYIRRIKVFYTLIIKNNHFTINFKTKHYSCVIKVIHFFD